MARKAVKLSLRTMRNSAHWSERTTHLSYIRQCFEQEDLLRTQYDQTLVPAMTGGSGEEVTAGYEWNAAVISNQREAV